MDRAPDRAVGAPRGRPSDRQTGLRGFLLGACLNGRTDAKPESDDSGKALPRVPASGRAFGNRTARRLRAVGERIDIRARVQARLYGRVASEPRRNRDPAFPLRHFARCENLRGRKRVVAELSSVGDCRVCRIDLGSGTKRADCRCQRGDDPRRPDRWRPVRFVRSIPTPLFPHAESISAEDCLFLNLLTPKSPARNRWAPWLTPSSGSASSSTRGCRTLIKARCSGRC